jgi:rubredoxin
MKKHRCTPTLPFFHEKNGIKGENGIAGDERMDRLMMRLHCPQCGTSFGVEPNKMRANMPTSCPSCGLQCGISEGEAIRAHRLLERLEYRKRIMNQSGPTTSAEKRSDSLQISGGRGYIP